VTRYLLDANAVIGVLRDASPLLSRRLRAHRPEDVAVSSVVAHELYYGAFLSARADANTAIVDALRFQVLDFDREDAREAGRLRAALARTGKTIGAYDVLIAGQAIARDLTLVTHNMREFGRVAGLRTEDWET
jgi:tRNA(fMet)-specific endonuclease VapC